MRAPGENLNGHLTIDREIETFDVTVLSGEVWDGEEYYDTADLYFRCEGHEVVVTLLKQDAELVGNQLLEAVGVGGEDGG